MIIVNLDVELAKKKMRSGEQTLATIEELIERF